MSGQLYDCPLYYIDYCIAGTDALQYKVRMDRDYKEARASYLKLCRLSASDFFFGLIKEAGLFAILLRTAASKTWRINSEKRSVDHSDGVYVGGTDSGWTGSGHAFTRSK